METADYPERPLIRSIFHPTDFSKSSHAAFAHALAIAVVAKAELIIMHVDSEVSGWKDFPQVRTTLSRWGLLEEHSPRSAVYEKLSVSIKKISARGRNPLSATLK